MYSNRYELVKKMLKAVKKEHKVIAIRSYGVCCMTCTYDSVKGDTILYPKVYKTGMNAEDFTSDKTFETVYFGWDFPLELLDSVVSIMQRVADEFGIGGTMIKPTTQASCIKLTFKEEVQ